MPGWLRVVSWNVGLLVAGLLVVELAFGSWFSAPRLWSLSIHRDVDWVLRENAYHRATPVHYRRDYFGLRGQFGTPADVTLLVIGGSTTDERKVSEGETWPEVMADCLKEKGIVERVANAGVPGQSTRGHLVSLDAWLAHVPGLKPRTMLVYAGINDRSLEGRDAVDDPTLYNESDKPVSYWRIFRKWAESSSALGALWRTVKGNLQARDKGLHTDAPAVAAGGRTLAEIHEEIYRTQAHRTLTRGSAEEQAGLAAVQAARAGDLEAYRQRLTRLVARIREMGARPILATQSLSSYRLSVDGREVRGNIEAYLDMTAFNRVTGEVCAAAGIACIPTGDRLVWEAGDTYDHVHTTASGSRKVGLTICEGLLASNALNR